MEQLNELFWAWLQTYYHERVHSAAKQKPVVRFEHDPAPLRRVDLAQLHDAFLLEDNRSVDKTGVFTRFQQPYQGPAGTILVRYDPYQPDRVQVWWEGPRYADATVLILGEHVGARSRPSAAGSPPVASGLNFLKTVAYQHQPRTTRDRLRYRQLREEHPDGKRT